MYCVVFCWIVLYCRVLYRIVLCSIVMSAFLRAPRKAADNCVVSGNVSLSTIVRVGPCWRPQQIVIYIRYESKANRQVTCNPWGFREAPGMPKPPRCPISPRSLTEASRNACELGALTFWPGSNSLYCIVLYRTVLYYIVMCCIVVYCIAFDCVVLYCIVLYCIVL